MNASEGSAVTAVDLDIAGFIAQAAVWLLCVFGLSVLVGSAVAAVVHAVI